MESEQKSTRASSGFGVGLVGGALLGCIASSVVAGGATYVGMKKRSAELHRGWHLAPVITINEPVRAGAVLTPPMLTQRQVPEQFVTASVVKPDELHTVIDLPVLVDLAPGDMLLRSQIHKGEPGKLAECLAGRGG